MNEKDFMNQPSGVSCGEWELTNAGLLFLEKLGLNKVEAVEDDTN